MRKKLIAGNWKMNMSKQSANDFISALLAGSFGDCDGGSDCDCDCDCDIALCVPFTLIETAARAANGGKIKIGGQNVSWADSGAFTGEISADMLTEAGAEYVIIGHSERRAMFNESDKTVNMRLIQSLKKGLKPIVCVGETLFERENNLTESVLARQLTGGLSGITNEQMQRIVIAYEPVWAIGTGKTATIEQAEAAAAFIRKTVAEIFKNNSTNECSANHAKECHMANPCKNLKGDCGGANLAEQILILYGGSMNASNAAELLSMPNIDGGLIGGASLKIAEFKTILSAAAVKKQ